MQSVSITAEDMSLFHVHEGGVFDMILYDKVCPLLSTGRWFYLGTTVSSINKTELHDIYRKII